MKRIFGFWLPALACFGLTSCGPMYQTDYIFTPPKSSSGKACIFQCDNGKMQCEQLEEMKSEHCEDRADRDEAACELNIRLSKGREPKWYECARDSCSVDNERCERNYRSCYQSCGGGVRQETRCVANCDQVPQQ